MHTIFLLVKFGFCKAFWVFLLCETGLTYPCLKCKDPLNSKVGLKCVAITIKLWPWHWNFALHLITSLYPVPFLNSQITWMINMFIPENYLSMKGWWKKVTIATRASLNRTFTLSIILDIHFHWLTFSDRNASRINQKHKCSI